MLIQNKYLYASLLIMTCFYSSVSLAGRLTIFDCFRGDVEQTQADSSENNVLHFDGLSRNRVTSQAIEAARVQRLWINHLPELCSSQLANHQGNYVSVLQAYLPLRVKFISSLYFALGSSRTTDTNIGAIRQEIIAAGKGAQLLIVGSADATGENTNNNILSLERARFLAEKIVNNNVSQTFIIPLGSKNSNGNQPQYRRADVYLLMHDISHQNSQ